MSQRDNGKFQHKISELEKFISGILESPMNAKVKKKIIDDLHTYKAKLIADSGKQARVKPLRRRYDSNLS